jgi:diaminobutyrate-2-oxoglutarate transaminase
VRYTADNSSHLMLAESNSRYYADCFPATFARSIGSHIYDVSGAEYIDFFAGAGALNYGHNHPDLVKCVIEYLQSSGGVHSLDMDTTARGRFIAALSKVFDDIAGSWKIMVTGPTGTNSVEAAFKICRRFTGRTDILAFQGGYHGMTLGALAATSNRSARLGAGVPLRNAYRIPYPTHNGEKHLELLESTLTRLQKRRNLPAALVLETIQAEGGVNLGASDYLNGITPILKHFGVLCIVDEIQTGCGRTGPFFSFQSSRLAPDIICTSKSLSGIGLPLAAIVFREEIDCLAPGQHSGTFRGPNLAFVAGARALEIWYRDSIQRETNRKSVFLQKTLRGLADQFSDKIKQIRGRGMIWGIEMRSQGFAETVTHEAFRKGLLVERCGPEKSTLKILPPLNIEDETLTAGLDIISQAIKNKTALP